MADEKQIFTLKQVTTSIQKVIQDRYSQTYWVQTEIHKLNYTSKGHCYPELVHKEDEKIVAEMRGTIWSSTFDKISKNFAATVKEPLRDGISVLMLVKIAFHPLYGMSLEILDIDPSYSLGELQKERDETIKRLVEEGIVNNNQKLTFPLLPKRVAIISMDSSKGLSDFYAITKNNPWNYSFFFMLFPAQLNGDLAIGSIINQLKRIKTVKDHFDVVLIIRGGGGEIGMSCYNNYTLAKAIATFPLPIMTGIGHSTNITVSELVAYKYAITPTELGKFLIEAFHEFSIPLEEARKSISQQTRILLEQKRNELRNDIRFLSKSTSMFLFENRNGLKTKWMQVQHKTIHTIQGHHLQMENTHFVLKHSVKNYLQIANANLENMKPSLKLNLNVQLSSTKKSYTSIKEMISKFAFKTIETNKNQLMLLENSIRLIDPIEVLKRGYSITLKNGKLISGKNPVKIGDQIETHTKDKILISEIKKLLKND